MFRVLGAPGEKLESSGWTAL